MTISRSVQQKMQSLQQSGYGRCVEVANGLTTPELFVVELDGVILIAYQDGFSVQQGQEVSFFGFDEVREIISCLTVDLYSQASAEQNVDFSLPLEIRLEVGSIVLSVPFLAYSRLLNVLVDMKRGVAS
ncbi:hypothetical protein [Pseudomonas tohonis]|uniref:hypothetical protein n=1 Tax=Pseudomonas tohonis TaxID=2725477 RepID=UPI0022F008CB|nr:hypothetical protein [Pseudomonas tohonis]